MNEFAETEPSADAEPRWQPLHSRQRRVLGVLMEKAKTTPDAYPLTLNALTNGCNQKSNRSPQMSLTSEDVEQALDELREMGAVAEVQGGSRVAKYRHYAYEWLGVDKQEMAVMAELLLRGEQTVGELRGRAARMEPIADVASLRPILDSLRTKKLVISLTPEGRGQIVTHGLHEPHELSSLSRFAPGRQAAETSSTAVPSPQASSSSASTAPPPPASPPAVTRDMFSELQVEVAELQAEVSRLRQQLQQLEDLVR